MIIDLPNGSKITLSTNCDSAGGALTITAPGGVPKPVAFGQQLRVLLRSLGDDAARVHLDTLTAWCRIALDRDDKRGVKATKRNRVNWQRSLAMIETAMDSAQMEAA